MKIIDLGWPWRSLTTCMVGYPSDSWAFSSSYWLEQCFLLLSVDGRPNSRWHVIVTFCSPTGEVRTVKEMVTEKAARIIVLYLETEFTCALSGTLTTLETRVTKVMTARAIRSDSEPLQFVWIHIYAAAIYRRKNRNERLWEQSEKLRKERRAETRKKIEKKKKIQAIQISVKSVRKAVRKTVARWRIGL